MQFPKKLVSPTQVGNGLSCYGLSYIRGGHWHQEILAHAMELCVPSRSFSFQLTCFKKGCLFLALLVFIKKNNQIEFF